MTSTQELHQKLGYWQRRYQSARTAVWRDVALDHIAVYRDVIERRAKRSQQKV